MCDSKLWILECAVKGASGVGQVLGVHQRKSVATNKFLRIVAEELLHGRTVVLKYSFLINNGENIEGILGQCPEIFFSANQLGFCSLAIVPFLRLLEGAAN